MAIQKLYLIVFVGASDGEFFCSCEIFISESIY